MMETNTVREVPHICARGAWIQYMMEYYKKVFPNATDHHWHKWAEATVDHEVEKLGDYFSHRMWRH
jgi:hypothetical protein